MNVNGMTITTWEDISLQYSDGANGFRWRLDGDLISRTDAEYVLGAWPGYIDALEDAYAELARQRYELEAAKRKCEKDYEEAREKLRAYYAEVRAIVEREAAELYANERHPLLRVWRTANAV